MFYLPHLDPNEHVLSFTDPIPLNLDGYVTCPNLLIIM